MPGVKQSGKEDTGCAGKQRDPWIRTHVGCEQEKSSNQESEPAGNEIDDGRRPKYGRIWFLSDSFCKMRKRVTAK